jgi:hypothetical protein
MADGKGGDELRVFDDLVVQKGWSGAPDAKEPNDARASSDEIDVIRDPFGSPLPKEMPPLPAGMPPLPKMSAQTSEAAGEPNEATDDAPTSEDFSAAAELIDEPTELDAATEDRPSEDVAEAADEQKDADRSLETSGESKEVGAHLDGSDEHATEEPLEAATDRDAKEERPDGTQKRPRATEDQDATEAQLEAAEDPTDAEPGEEMRPLPRATPPLLSGTPSSRGQPAVAPAATPPPPWARTTSSSRPMPIAPVSRSSIVPPPPPRSTARGIGTPLPPPIASLPPLPKALRFSDAASASTEASTSASAEHATDNPFLAPIKSREQGGPASLLPPPPTNPTSAPATPQKRATRPPPALLRTTAPSARPLPPPPPRSTSSSMIPPPAFSGTVPPYRRRSLDSEISLLQSKARRKKIATFGALAALGIAAFYARSTMTTSAATAVQPVEKASLHATAKHDGIKLVLDGKEIGALPQDIQDLSPGEHSIVFEGSDRYASQKNVVTLAPSEKKELELVSLKVTRGQATFDVKTPGTTLELVSGDERRPITDFSRPVDVDTSKSWSLEASKPGFRTFSMPVIFDDQAEKTFVVTLTEPIRPGPQVETPAPQQPTNEVALATGDNADKVTHALAPKPEPAKADPLANKAAPAPAPQAPVAAASTKPAATIVPAAAPAPAPAPAAKAPSGNCLLNINSLPTSKITLDGHMIGFTPKLGISVPAGTHSIMLVSDSGRKATSATCKAGETKTVAIRMTSQ